MLSLRPLNYLEKKYKKETDVGNLCQLASLKKIVLRNEPIWSYRVHAEIDLCDPQHIREIIQTKHPRKARVEINTLE